MRQRRPEHSRDAVAAQLVMAGEGQPSTTCLRAGGRQAPIKARQSE